MACWEEVAEIIASIPEPNCTGEEAEFLYHLSKKSGELGEIVEIGTNVGKTAIALAFGQKEKNGRPIYTVDIYQHPHIEDNLQRARVSDFVVRIVASSTATASKWNKPIELLWIDGDHCYIGVMFDIKHWTRFVIAGGLIVFHDYPGHKGTTEIWKAVHRNLLAKPREWRIVSDRDTGSIIVLERLENNIHRMSTKSRLYNYFYWRYRNVRSLIFRYLPGMSSKIVQFLKGNARHKKE